MSEYLANLSNGEIDEKGFLRHLGLFVQESGVVQADALAVTAQDTPDMSVVVSGGATGHDIIFVTDAGDTYHGWNTADYTVTIAANATGSSKTDSIIAYADLASGSATANNPGGLKFVSVRGASTTPTTSEIETAIGAGNPWEQLSSVTVANGASSVNSGNIVDTRAYAHLKGSLIDDGSVTSAKIAQAFFKGRYQKDNNNTIASSDESGLTVQFGWCQIIGNGTSAISEAITFPTAFSTVLLVVASPMGGLAAGVASDITTLQDVTANPIVVSANSPRTTGFNLQMLRTGGTFGSTSYYAASWIAIGTI